MELRFFVGYLTGAAMLAALYHFDPVWWVTIVVCLVVFAGVQAVTHRMFDR